MKRFFFIGLVLLGFLAACVRTPELDESQERSVSELAVIDSLMWQQPDSALKCLTLRFDSCITTEYSRHYANLLLAELFARNDCSQNNRTDLLQAVEFFDSLCDGTNVGRDASTYAFLSARTHYINGVGYYKQDSVVSACAEYLKALEIMEVHFPEIETQELAALRPRHIPLFLGLTYGRLSDLFSDQNMKELVIVCCNKILVFDSIEPISRLNRPKKLMRLGIQYYTMQQYDSAAYYYDEAIRNLPDTNNLVYRKIMVQKALLYWAMDKTELTLSILKRVVAQETDEIEKMKHYLVLGGFYYSEDQFDSALVYLMPAYESRVNAKVRQGATEFIRAIYQRRGDTLMAAHYVLQLNNNTFSQAHGQGRVATLGDMFQQHLQWEEERQLAKERQLARQHKVRGVVITAIVLLVMGLGLWWWLAKRKHERDRETEALRQEQQQQRETFNQQLSEAQDALKQKEWDALMTKVNAIYSDKQKDTRGRIIKAFDAAYPQFEEQFKATYPDLNETARHLIVLNLLRFRAKEEATILNLTENTVLKYRSKLNKKVDFDQVLSWME